MVNFSSMIIVKLLFLKMIKTKGEIETGPCACVHMHTCTHAHAFLCKPVISVTLVMADEPVLIPCDLSPYLTTVSLVFT